MNTHYAYALGYWQGRNEGTDNMPQWITSAEERRAWRMGYDRGVTDYCEEDLGI